MRGIIIQIYIYMLKVIYIEYSVDILDGFNSRIFGDFW